MCPEYCPSGRDCACDAGGGDEVSVAVAVDPDVQPASVPVAVVSAAVVASPVAVVAQPAAVPPVGVAPVPCGSLVVAPVDVPSAGGADVGSVTVVPGSGLVDVSAVPVDVGSVVEDGVVSVDVVVVAGSAPAVAAGGVVPVSAAAG